MAAEEGTGTINYGMEAADVCSVCALGDLSQHDNLGYVCV